MCKPPSVEGGERRHASGRLENLARGPQGRAIINAHGTSTPVGDVGRNRKAVRAPFGAGTRPPVRSTQVDTGHAAKGPRAH